MKTQTLTTLVALASTASATYDWSHASPFSCPSNTDNNCNKDQQGGFNWVGLNLGSFSNYGGFDFEGFSCASSFGGSKKRDQLTGRTFQDKCITGKASDNPKNSPSFGCGSTKDVDKFSVDHFQISVEFDCSLQFHYGMPDGSTCKQTSSCSKHGTTVKNTQCGGAKNVTVVYPGGGKGNGGKGSCSIGVHSVGFDCNTKSSTRPPTYSTKPPKPVTTTTPSKPTTTPSKPTTTPSKPTTSAASTTPVSSPPVVTPSSTSPVETTPPVQTTPISSPVGGTTTSIPSTSEGPSTYLTTSTIFQTSVVSTVISCSEGVKNCPGSSTSTILTTVLVPVSTTICPVTSEQTPSTTPKGPSSTPEVPTTTPKGPEGPSSTPGVPTTTPKGPEGPTTTPEGPTTTPAQSSPVPTSSAQGSTFPPEDVTTTVIIDTTTTVCPVTLTHTSAGTTSIETGITTSTIVITSTHTTCKKCNGAPTSAPSPTTSAGGEVTTSAPSGPSPTAPCPEILPQCLNTWMFSSGCTDNTDSSCYCPSSDFVCNVFDCLSAHGASDDDIASAQTYFQGICAPHIATNPGIVTCAAPVTPSNGGSTPSVPVTTIQVQTTILVPCSESGTLIPSSSTTSVLSTQLTVPQVVFQTITGATTASAALVQGTPAAVPAVTTPDVPAQTTIATVPISNGTAPTSSPPATFEGASSHTSTAITTLVAAFLVTLLAM